MVSLDLFPPEMIEKIFSYLSVDDLLSASRVNVSWYIASNNSAIWRAAMERSFSRDRFIKLSDLDKFNEISSNYDSDHSFNVEKPSTSCLPPMNPWKLSLCRHNFVRRNLRGDRPNLKLARHEIALEDDMEICNLNVKFPSKSAQDCLYLPVVGRKQGENNKEFYLIRLDGAPKVIKLLTTEAEFYHACTDRHGIVWVERNEENYKINYLPFGENVNSFQSRNSESLLFESDIHNFCVITPPYDFSTFTMNANYLAVCTMYLQKQVKIWCRKTFKLKMTLTLEKLTHSFYLNNGHFYVAFSQDMFFNEHTKFYLKIYDVKQDKLISVLDIESQILRIVFGAKYYAIVSGQPSDYSICVRKNKDNMVMFNTNIRRYFYKEDMMWFVDDYFLYVDGFCLKVLNLTDWTVSFGLSLKDYKNVVRFELDVIDSCLLVIQQPLSRTLLKCRVDVWDWKLGRKVQVDETSQIMPMHRHFYANEIRLVYVRKTSVEVVGFW